MKRLLMLVILVGLLAGCDMLSSGDRLTGQAALDETARLMAVSPPETATNVQAEYMVGFQDDVAWLRFDLPAAEVDAFIDQLCTQPINLGEGIGGLEYPAWWYASDSGVTRLGQCLSTHAYIYLSADESNADTHTLYITMTR